MDFMVNAVLPGWGWSSRSLSSPPLPACSCGCPARLPVRSACSLLPLHVVSPLRTARGRRHPPFSHVPRMLMLGVAEAGRRGFAFSSAARQFQWGPGERTGVRQLWSQLRLGNCLWDCQYEKYCQTTKSTGQ